MARDWTLADTPALGGSLALGASGFTAVNDDADLVFFFDSTGQHIWSWAANGTLTDISGTTFTGVDEQILDICWFDGNLYVVYIYNASEEGKVSRWDGGTTWTDVWVIDEGGTAGVFSSLTANMQFLDADADRVTVAGFVTTGDRRIASSEDGLIWTIETVEGSVTYAYLGIVYGLSHGGSPRTYVLTNTATQVNRVCINDGAGNWEQVNPDAFHSAIHVFNAAAAGLSFWFTSAPHRIVYSLDFGETFDSAGISSDVSGVLRTLISTLSNGAAEVVMACDRTDNQAYTWDPIGLTFATDGATGSDTILAFFRLGGALYALCESPTPGEAAIYTANAFAGYTDEAEVRLIGLDSDGQYLYLTALADGTLRAYAYQNGVFVREWDFGAVTFAEIDGRDYGLWPRVRPGTDKLVYLYGRDGSDIQVQLNDLNDLNGWGDVGDGGWVSTKVAVALLPDPLRPDDLVAVFSDDDIYRSTEPTIAWSKIADAPATVRAADRHPLDSGHVLLAAIAADTIYFSHNLGLSTYDVSDAALDTINAIEVSRE
jgi:hypothetical protein